MRARTASHAQHKIGLLAPTVTKQCWGFMIGSACFALGSAPGLSNLLGSSANLLFFIGAWFFTGAGFMQLFLSGGSFDSGPLRPRQSGAVGMADCRHSVHRYFAL